jgi:hypothetical protein
MSVGLFVSPEYDESETPPLEWRVWTYVTLYLRFGVPLEQLQRDLEELYKQELQERD